jgi:hypothetical protein
VPAVITDAQAWVLVIELAILNAILAAVFIVGLVLGLHDRARGRNSPGA